MATTRCAHPKGPPKQYSAPGLRAASQAVLIILRQVAPSSGLSRLRICRGAFAWDASARILCGARAACSGTTRRPHHRPLTCHIAEPPSHRGRSIVSSRARSRASSRGESAAAELAAASGRLRRCAAAARLWWCAEHVDARHAITQTRCRRSAPRRRDARRRHAAAATPPLRRRPPPSPYRRRRRARLSSWPSAVH
jgi:hypothetical protein